VTYGGEPNPRPKVTVRTLREMKERGQKIVSTTAYDHPSAVVADQAGVDLLLVGDSVGMVVLGYDSTIPVTMAACGPCPGVSEPRAFRARGPLCDNAGA